jgi:hypothetical protein
MNIKIIIAQRGWVFVGLFTSYKARNGSNYLKLEQAYNIGNFGTDDGIGQLALQGPTRETKLMPCGKIELHELTSIGIVDCNAEVWASKFEQAA